ncbi:MAG: hypothetical protein ONB44_08445 [candidate division KSB1 bacterium]|nr:hypothetical protein [candidate division KSB1 bacterium]MDZ7302158.1 hypothetical protein [candidate division KSB1 bacterium]
MIAFTKLVWENEEFDQKTIYEDFTEKKRGSRDKLQEASKKKTARRMPAETAQ